MQERSQLFTQDDIRLAFLSGLKVGQEMGGVRILSSETTEETLWHGFSRWSVLNRTSLPRIKDLL